MSSFNKHTGAATSGKSSPEKDSSTDTKMDSKVAKSSSESKKTKARIPPHPSIAYSNSSDNNITEDEDEEEELGKSPKKQQQRNGEEKSPGKRKNPGRKARSDLTSDATTTDDDKKSSPKKPSLPIRKNPGRKAKSDDNFSSDQDDLASGRRADKLNQIPESVRFDPNSLENKPKGLVDSLSKYFTPGVKRTSRTALSSLLKPNSDMEPKSKRRKSHGHEPRVSSPRSDGRKSQSDSEGDRDQVRERKRHTSSGQSQVRSLYDGLSHLYTDCDSRLRHIPPANYAEKRRRQLEDGVADSADNGDGRVRSPESGPQTPQRVMSPHRMSDSERQGASSAASGGIKPGTVFDSSSATASRTGSRAESLRSAVDSGAEAMESGAASATGSLSGRKQLKGGSK
jgi:hypothetical protein